MVLFSFQFYSVWNFGKFISFGLGTVRSERVQMTTYNEKVVHIRIGWEKHTDKKER